MAKENLTNLSREELEKKAKGLKMFMLFFVPLILGLVFFLVRDYLNGEEMDWSLFTIAICTLGGPATLYPQWKEVQDELNARG